MAITILHSKTPTAIYSSPGNYTVKLIIKNTSGTDSVIKTQFIVVGDKPVLNFSVNDSTGCVPVNVQFTDQSAEQLVKWEWDFGDGQTSSLQSPSHTYTIGGEFTVTLKAENSNGCSNVAARSGLIKVQSVPKVDFTYSAPPNCSTPVQVNFTNSSEGSAPLTYQWSFGMELLPQQRILLTFTPKQVLTLFVLQQQIHLAALIPSVIP
jgi:PKD repeat protein